MKKLINLTIIFTIILSLTFITTVQTNAASKVNITYYANNGYFKAKPNRNKSKITIKSKINKKRGYAPAIRRDGYTFDGWYTKKKGGKKYSASTIITKKQKLYPHWIKKYKINTKYFVPMGLSLSGINDFQKYYGKLAIIKKNVKKNVYPGEYYCKNNKGDLISIFSWSGYDNDYFQIDALKCKLKNIINIKKTTSLNLFLKKLDVKEYNYNSKTHTIDFICGKCYCNYEEDEDAEYEDVWWTIKMNDKNQLTPDTVVNFDLITDWQLW
ncbi:InlB B-repeat-containing protein [uncultured Eubacterium sp.]|uniref:InlB B-repeat-containing protein n=1 Tax=uncultured Eubacterium sp. TaxID=165185 RepID=UPI002594EA38|nr:InlB B-repeat-containing protein [uncultured Eubacterium sp.]